MQSLEELGIERLHKNINASSTGKAHFPGSFVSHAKMQELWTISLQHLHAGLEYGAFHAAAAHRARDLSIGCERHFGSCAPGRRSPRLHDCRERNGCIIRLPIIEVGQNIAHEYLHWAAARDSPIDLLNLRGLPGYVQAENDQCAEGQPVSHA